MALLNITNLAAPRLPVHRFYSRTAGPAQLLSNFAPVPVGLQTYEGGGPREGPGELAMFHTGESAFQWSKLMSALPSIASPDLRRAVLAQADAIRKMTNPLAAKRASGKARCPFTKEQLAAWDGGGADAVQAEICRYKLDHCAELRAFLVATWPCVYLHQDNRATPATPWGGKLGASGEIVGQNKLGRLWAQVIQQQLEGRPADV